MFCLQPSKAVLAGRTRSLSDFEGDTVVPAWSDPGCPFDSIPSTDSADIPRATQYVPQALSGIAAAKPVSRPLTQPCGCSVKYANG